MKKDDDIQDQDQQDQDQDQDQDRGWVPQGVIEDIGHTCQALHPSHRTSEVARLLAIAERWFGVPGEQIARDVEARFADPGDGGSGQAVRAAITEWRGPEFPVAGFPGAIADYHWHFWRDGGAPRLRTSPREVRLILETSDKFLLYAVRKAGISRGAFSASIDAERARWRRLGVLWAPASEPASRHHGRQR